MTLPTYFFFLLDIALETDFFARFRTSELDKLKVGVEKTTYLSMYSTIISPSDDVGQQTSLTC